MRVCVQCGYNLTGLADEGLCPECGFAYTLETTIGGVYTPAPFGGWLLMLAPSVFLTIAVSIYRALPYVVRGASLILLLIGAIAVAYFSARRLAKWRYTVALQKGRMNVRRRGQLHVLETTIILLMIQLLIFYGWLNIVVILSLARR